MVLPIVAVALACSDSTILQPDPRLGADVVSTGIAVSFRLLEDPANDDWGTQWVTPGGILQVRGADFGYLVVGDLVGQQRTRGDELVLNLNNGKGTAAGTMLFVLTAPGAGTFECRFHGSIENFPLHIQRGVFYDCKGSGYYADLRMKGSYNNESNPGVGDFDATAEIW
jgi:hypothetical protein